MKKSVFFIFTSGILIACNGKTYYCDCTYTDTSSVKKEESHNMECISRYEAIKECNRERDYLLQSPKVSKEEPTVCNFH
jgi:hypothetical protein